MEDESMNNSQNENNEENEEQQFDEDGNPIPKEDETPKIPENPLKLDLLQKNLSKLSKTYSKMIY